MKRIYICGPISDIEDGNRHAFGIAVMQLDILGHESVNPHNNGLRPDASWAEHMRAYIPMMLACDAVALLPGWENSKGARLERIIAMELGMDVRTIEEWRTPSSIACGC